MDRERANGAVARRGKDDAAAGFVFALFLLDGRDGTFELRPGGLHLCLDG
jgi:hypothetical protein